MLDKGNMYMVTLDHAYLGQIRHDLESKCTCWLYLALSFLHEFSDVHVRVESRTGRCALVRAAPRLFRLPKPPLDTCFLRSLQGVS
jgi:hypothetical protein